MIVLIFSIILCIYTTNEIYSNIDEYIDVYLHYKLIKKSIPIIPMCLLLRNKNMQVTKFNQIMNKNNEKIKGINNYSSNLVEREGENKFNNVNSDNKNRDGGVENIKIFKEYFDSDILIKILKKERKNNVDESIIENIDREIK